MRSPGTYKPDHKIGIARLAKVGGVGGLGTGRCKLEGPRLGEVEALEGANGCRPCPLQLRLHHAADEDEQIRFGPVEQVGGRVWHSNHPSTVCGGPSLRRPNRLRGRSRIRGGERPGDGGRVEHRLRFSIIPALEFQSLPKPRGSATVEGVEGVEVDSRRRPGAVAGSRPGIRRSVRWFLPRR